LIYNFNLLLFVGDGIRFPFQNMIAAGLRSIVSPAPAGARLEIAKRAGES